MRFLLKLVPFFIEILKRKVFSNMSNVESKKNFNVKSFCADLKNGYINQEEMYSPIISAIFNSDLIIRYYLELESVEDNIFSILLLELEKEYLYTFSEEDKALMKSSLYDYYFNKRF